MRKIDRTGEINYNYQNCLMKIISYNYRRDIVVEFQDEYHGIVHTQYENFRKGRVKNPYYPEVYNIGYLGNGKYVPYIENHAVTKQYDSWHHIIQRCYSEKIHKKFPTYKGCSLCKKWENFQNFGQWFDENLYFCDKEQMHIDKDILLKGNKVYSPETCVFVPQRINVLFVKGAASRGKYPIGVHFDKSINKFKALVCVGDRQKNVGNFNNPESAFIAYKQAKEKYIKEIADEYKNKYLQFPDKLYQALYKYQVEITD